MSIVAYGLSIEPLALVGPVVWGYTLKAVIPPPVTTTVDPFAKHANTQVIRESHLRKHLKLKKRKEVERVDLDTQQVVAAGLLPTSVDPITDRTLTALKTFGASDARHIERAARLIARIAIDDSTTLGAEDLNLLKMTPEVLKKIH